MSHIEIRVGFCNNAVRMAALTRPVPVELKTSKDSNAAGESLATTVPGWNGADGPLFTHRRVEPGSRWNVRLGGVCRTQPRPQCSGCTARFDGAESNGAAMETVLVRLSKRSAVLRPPGREQDRVWWGPDGYSGCYSGWHGYVLLPIFTEIVDLFHAMLTFHL